MGIFYSRVIQPINTFLSLGSWMWWAIASGYRLHGCSRHRVGQHYVELVLDDF